jgi:hypothetical protein
MDEDDELHLFPFSFEPHSSPQAPPTPPSPQIITDSQNPLASKSCVSLDYAGVADIAGATTIPTDSDPYTAFTHSGHSEIP